MSSNLQVQRVCQLCSKEFTARTTVTKYCSHKCSQRAYKIRKRSEKSLQSEKETKELIKQPIENIKAKAFLTVKDVALLLNCSIRTVYRLIAEGSIKAVNISQRKTLIKRSDIDLLFKESIRQKTESIPEQQKQDLSIWKQSGQFDIADCYTLTEIQNKYGVSEKALHEIIKRNEIPKIKKGWYAYVPKPFIDKLLT